jgi:rare lipoprotein A
MFDTCAAAAAAALFLGPPPAAEEWCPAMSFQRDAPPAVLRTATGLASWYGPGLAGRRTANGERFDPADLSAAHHDWRFGTVVRVTCLRSGRSVVVRINDRFPAHKGRLIDVSRGAARAIGLIGPGPGRVRLEVLAD